jgi:uncharacterized damage-inducible protein DinB
MNLREFLTSPIAYLAPDKVTDGLTATEAEWKSAEAGHSIAEIVAHLAFWQDWFYSRCTGQGQPMIASAAQGWPAVAPGSWPELRARFLERLETLAALADGDVTAPLTPPIEFPPLAEYTLSDALVHVATHNAHHLGQVIVLRQLQGTWPPPAGSWTW